VIGDAVNLASRIEQLNKEFEAQVLISQAVWQAIQTELPLTGTSLGTVPIKGREVPVEIYKLA
jgi:adenylate cyclase